MAWITKILGALGLLKDIIKGIKDIIKWIGERKKESDRKKANDALDKLETERDQRDVEEILGNPNAGKFDESIPDSVFERSDRES